MANGLSPKPIANDARRDPLIPTIFHEPWWLEAASRGRYEEVTVRSGDRDVGRLPYLRERRLGMHECILPDLTPFLGPAVDEGEGRAVQRLIRRRRIIHELLDKLPPHSRFRQRLHGGSADALPFLEYRFSSDAEYTYEIAPAPCEALWVNVRDTTRRVVRRAGERSTLIDIEPSLFQHLYETNLRRRGKTFNYMWDNGATPLFEAAIARGRGRLLAARDAAGRIGAGIFFAWDHRTTYLLLSTRSPGAHSGLMSLLIWEAIKQSAAVGRVFDFGGVGTQGSFLFYAGFGGEATPRIVVQQASPIFRMADLTMRKMRSASGKLIAPIVRRLTYPEYRLPDGPLIQIPPDERTRPAVPDAATGTFGRGDRKAIRSSAGA